MRDCRSGVAPWPHPRCGLQIDNDEVVLRRTIGVKKDEYFLNRKHVTKVRFAGAHA